MYIFIENPLKSRERNTRTAHGKSADTFHTAVLNHCNDFNGTVGSKNVEAFN